MVAAKYTEEDIIAAYAEGAGVDAGMVRSQRELWRKYYGEGYHKLTEQNNLAFCILRLKDNVVGLNGTIAAKDAELKENKIANDYLRAQLKETKHQLQEAEDRAEREEEKAIKSIKDAGVKEYEAANKYAEAEKMFKNAMELMQKFSERSTERAEDSKPVELIYEMRENMRGLFQKARSGLHLKENMKVNLVKVLSSIYDVMIETNPAKTTMTKSEFLIYGCGIFGYDVKNPAQMLSNSKRNENYLDIFRLLSENAENAYMK